MIQEVCAEEDVKVAFMHPKGPAVQTIDFFGIL